MSASAEFVRHVKDLLAPLGNCSDGSFFGGHALKQHGHQFAMIMGNTLYFRVDDTTRPTYEQHGASAFSYATRKGRVQVRKYYSAPEALFEDQQLLLAWARQAINAASQA
ncbi:hypothetical protein IGB42_01897 [Andreprevotia sp. IGB-42]|uniref:TfoX/Sxy family protein n=1 Tax=Andreprevotia sp. IGB-42 TaxID=2497473 RepID=UPI00135BD7A7|nr:TfoX/Sxy family protein [Andreprevotia sp. IGB-42]KAF0813546.1 hypothetical protein IGB42_01897 [Andreprevotia sp. IGB-42]